MLNKFPPCPNNDPSLARFTSADTLVPPGPQGLDRYAYANNNPLSYADPSGHTPCDADGICEYTDDLYLQDMLDTLADDYNVTFGDGWDIDHIAAVFYAVVLVGNKLAVSRNQGETSAAAFTAVYNEGITFVWDTQCDKCRGGTILEQNTEGRWVSTGQACGSDYTSPGCVPGGGVTSGTTKITFASMTGDNDNTMNRRIKNVVHELGHVFYNLDPKDLGGSFTRAALIPNIHTALGDRIDWQQHPPSMNVDGNDRPEELFADTFLAWTYDAWNPLNMVQANTAGDTITHWARNR